MSAIALTDVVDPETGNPGSQRPASDTEVGVGEACLVVGWDAD
jgi:hypothetical protein